MFGLVPGVGLAVVLMGFQLTRQRVPNTQLAEWSDCARPRPGTASADAANTHFQKNFMKTP
jgi:hypothetical protein